METNVTVRTPKLVSGGTYLEVGEVRARGDVEEEAEHPLDEVGRAELRREAALQRQRRRQHRRLALRLRLHHITSKLDTAFNSSG